MSVTGSYAWIQQLHIFHYTAEHLNILSIVWQLLDSGSYNWRRHLHLFRQLEDSL